MNGAFAEQVRQRAYKMWVADGCVDGRAHDHWVAAERGLLSEATQVKQDTLSKRTAAKSGSTKSGANTSGVKSTGPRTKKAAAKPAANALKARAAARTSPAAGGASA